jgi:hypothetical protein
VPLLVAPVLPLDPWLLQPLLPEPLVPPPDEPLLVAPVADEPLLVAPVASMSWLPVVLGVELQAASAVASKPAISTLSGFRFMMNSFVGCQTVGVCVTMPPATKVRGANREDVPVGADDT